MISGVILAAGASTRMGQVKAALPIGTIGETVVSRVVRTLTEGGIPRIVVVVGAHADAVRRALPAVADPSSKTAIARIVEHPGWQRGQLSSLLAGLDAIDDPALEAALVTPVDVPLVSAATVATLVEAWRASRGPIVRPVQGDRHGHPVIFDRSVFDALRRADPNVGAKAVFRAYQDRVVDVSVDDPGAFEDIDTPEDYRRVLGLGVLGS